MALSSDGLYKKQKESLFIVYSGVILIVALMLFISLFSYFKFKDQLYGSLFKEREAIAVLSSRVLADRFERSIDIGYSLVTRESFISLIRRGAWNLAIQNIEGAPTHFPFIDRFFLTDTSGKFKADFPVLLGVRESDYSQYNWFRAVMATGRPYISGIHERAGVTPVNVLIIALPIIKDEQALGVLALQVSIESLLEWVGDIDVRETGSIYVVDSRGRLASEPDIEDEIIDYSGFPPVENVIKGEKGSGFFYNEKEKQEWLVAYKPVNGADWGVLVAESSAEALKEIKSTLFFILMIYLLIIIAGLFFILVFIRNIKKLYRIQFQVLELNKELEMKIDMVELSHKELDGFTYSVSHDLRAPLRAINSFSKILIEDYNYKLDEEGNRLLNVIFNEARKMGNLIDDLLSLTKLSKSIEKNEVDMRALAKEARENIINPGGRVEVKIQELFPVLGEKDLLRQVFVNLLSNAVKFSIEKEKPVVEVGSYEKGNELVYFVKDNGIGFDPRYAENLFKPFHKLHVDEAYEGTGIGLAISKRIIDFHGGRVWFDAEPGKGATFFFSLPKTN